VEESFLYKNLGFKLLGICFDIHNNYGCGNNEIIYQSLLAERFEKECLKFSSQPKIPLFSKLTSRKIGFYVPDFLLEDKIIIEIKATDILLKRQEIQLLEYLKTTPYEIGYLINFGLPKLYYKKIYLYQ
jgi:GxxExxY protein